MSNKLPTAEQSIGRLRGYYPDEAVNELPKEAVLVSMGDAIDAIESHTAAHTAALQERVKELEAKLTRLDKECECLSAENTDLSYQIEGKKQDNKFLVKKMTELKAENARYRDRIGEALKFLQSRQQTTPGLGAPVTILKQALEK